MLPSPGAFKKSEFGGTLDSDHCGRDRVEKGRRKGATRGEKRRSCPQRTRRPGKCPAGRARERAGGAKKNADLATSQRNALEAELWKAKEQAELVQRITELFAAQPYSANRDHSMVTSVPMGVRLKSVLAVPCPATLMQPWLAGRPGT